MLKRGFQRGVIREMPTVKSVTLPDRVWAFREVLHNFSFHGALDPDGEIVNHISLRYREMCGRLLGRSSLVYGQEERRSVQACAR